MLKKTINKFLATPFEGQRPRELRDSADAISVLYRFLHDNDLESEYVPLKEVQEKADQLFTAILMAYTTAVDDIQRAILLQAEEKMIFGLQPLPDPTRARHYSKLAGKMVKNYIGTRLQKGTLAPKLTPLPPTTDDRPQLLEAEMMRLMKGYLFLYSEVSLTKPHFTTLEGYCYEEIILNWQEQLGKESTWSNLTAEAAQSRQVVMEDYWQTFEQADDNPQKANITTPADTPRHPLAEKLISEIAAEEKIIQINLFV